MKICLRIINNYKTKMLNFLNQSSKCKSNYKIAMKFRNNFKLKKIIMKQIMMNSKLKKVNLCSKLKG